MPKKPSSKDKNKIGGVKQAKQTKQIDGPASVSSVAEVKKAAGVGGVKGIQGARRRPTRTMTTAEREKLFSIISEEADKMFGKDKVDPKKREIIESAVKMAVDAGLLDEGDEDDNSEDKN